MRYNSREEVEQIGSAGSYYEDVDGYTVARMLSSFWLVLDDEDEGFYPHATTLGEGFWEAWITAWMSQNVAPGSRCLDIGANIGYYTMFLLEHRCQVRAVEPQPRLADLIEKSVAYNRFRLIDDSVDQVAVGNESGMVTMLVPPNHGMNAYLTDLDYGVEGETIEVYCRTLNDYVDGENRYNFVKVDIEGAEETLFDDADQFIATNPGCTYLVEWSSGRMTEPVAAAERLFEKFNLWYVDFAGNEVPIERPEGVMESSMEDWIMLVLRNKI